MQPFAIYCTTCKARLRVTDPSFIGQILACPKCESMVLVEPPPASAAESSMAAKPAASGGTSSVILQAPVPPAPPPLPQVLQARVAPPQVVSSVVQPVGAAAHTAAAVASVKPPRDWMLFAGGIAVGAVIGVAIWLLVAMRDTGGEATVASTANAANVESEPQLAPISADEPELPKIPEPAQPEAVEALKPVVDEPVVNTTIEPKSVERDATADEPLVPAEPTPPADLEPATAEPIAASKPNESATEPTAAVEPTESDEPAPPADDPKSPVTDPQLAQLSVRLPKVAFDKVPLRQFAAFAAEASGAKIVIDYQSLRAAGFKSPTVTARSSNCSVQEMLHQSLDRIGLAFEPRDGSIVIFAPQR